MLWQAYLTMQAYLLTEQAGMNVKVGAFPGGGTRRGGRAVIRASRRTRVMANKAGRGTEVYKTYMYVGCLFVQERMYVGWTMFV